MQITFRGKTIPVEYVPAGSMDTGVFLRHLAEKKVVLGIDIETYPDSQFPDYPKGGIDPLASRIRLIQIYDGETVYVFEYNVASFNGLRDLFQVGKFVAHNALFELAFFKHFFSADPDVGCTQIMYRLYVHATDSNPEIRNTGLAAACKEILGEDIDKTEQKSDWGAEYLHRDQLEYAALDAVVTRELAFAMAPKIQELGLGRIYKINKAAQYALVEMQLNGIYVDQEKHLALIEDWKKKQLESEFACKAIIGEDVNLNSSKQMHEWITSTYPVSKLRNWKRTAKSGMLSINTENLKEHSHLVFTGPLLENKKYEKLLSTYGDELRTYIHPVTNRIHPSFTIAKTVTGRLSVNSPNIQNQPKGSGMRGIYIPFRDNVFTVADYNQIELRVLACVTQDPVMLEVYHTGQDLHAKTAAAMAAIGGVTYSDLSDEDKALYRNRAKAINFGIVFGIGPKKLGMYAKLNYGAEMTEGEARAAIKAFKDTYPVAAEWMRMQTKICGHYLIVRTPAGRVRKLDKDYYYTTALNTPAQAGAAEVNLIALDKLHKNKPLPYSLVNNVHDEIILEHLPEFTGQVQEHVVQSMTEAYLELFPGGPATKLVGIDTGTSWEEAK